MFNQIKGCFDKEPVNFGRQKELDIAKGIIIIGMVFAHGLGILAEFIGSGDPIASVEIYEFVFDGAIGAPVFIFCMGISFSYSRRNTANDMFRRALITFGLVLLLEIARTAIPELVSFLTTGDAEFLSSVYWALYVDVLQFVTLALFLIALFKKLNLRPITMVIISVICSFIGQLLYGVSTGSYAGDVVAGYIWHSYDGTFFPLLNWLIFPVCGYAFGGFWLRLRDKDTFFRLITPICWVITILHYASALVVGEWFHRSGAYLDGLGILYAMFALVACFAMIGLGYYLAKLGGHVANWLGSMGVRVTSIYFIHWTIYGFIRVMGSTIPLWSLVCIPVLVLISSDLLSRYLVNVVASRRNRAKGVSN